MDELPNFTLAFEGNFTSAGALWFQLCMNYLQRGGGGRSIETLLAPGNYPEVLVQPRWWNVLMFMHMKGITQSNSRPTIPLPHCVIINGLCCIENAGTQPYYVPNITAHKSACAGFIWGYFIWQKGVLKWRKRWNNKMVWQYFLFQIHGASQC